MEEKRPYKNKTKIKIDRYLFTICSNERCLVALEDWGRMPYNILTQIISLDNIDTPLGIERLLIGKSISLEEIDTTHKSLDYISKKHQQLVSKMKHAPWRYLKKIKKI